MEKLVVPRSRIEGGSVVPSGEMGCRSPRFKAVREESEKLKEAQMEVNGEVSKEESAAIQSPKNPSDAGRIRRISGLCL